MSTSEPSRCACWTNVRSFHNTIHKLSRHHSHTRIPGTGSWEPNSRQPIVGVWRNRKNYIDHEGWGTSSKRTDGWRGVLTALRVERTSLRSPLGTCCTAITKTQGRRNPGNATDFAHFQSNVAANMTRVNGTCKVASWRDSSSDTSGSVSMASINAAGGRGP